MASNAIKVVLKDAGLKNLAQHFPDDADKLVGSVAFDFERYVKEHFTVTSGAASMPGEPPAIQTGELKNSIKAKREKLLKWSVNSTKKKSVYLEYGTRHMRARPFFTPAATYFVTIIPGYVQGFLTGIFRGLKP